MEKFNIEKPEEKESEIYIKSLLLTIDNLLENPKYKGQTREQIGKQIEDLYNKIKNLTDMIIERVQPSSERVGYFNKLLVFGKKLENKYSRDKCLQCLAWHILIGSTPSKEDIKFFDFEGEDSIVNFVNDFYNELIEENKEKDNR